MKYAQNGRITITAEDIAKFNKLWPGSPLTCRNRYVVFDKRGDLVDHNFPLSEDGFALVALIEDAMAYLPEDW
jgi:hypothetical protein